MNNDYDWPVLSFLVYLSSFAYYAAFRFNFRSPVPCVQFHQFRSSTDIIFHNLDEAHSFFLIQTGSLSLPTTILVYPSQSSRRHSVEHGSTARTSRSNFFLFLLIILSGNVELNPGPNSVTFTHLNIRSIRNKSPSLLNELIANPADILGLNETWLSPSDSTAYVESLIPPGYSILNASRTTGTGGGVATIFRSHLRMSRVDYPPEQPTSFECLISKLTHGNKQIIFINIYRPPSSSLATFFQEFPALLEFFYFIAIRNRHNWRLQYTRRHRFYKFCIFFGFRSYSLCAFTACSFPYS